MIVEVFLLNKEPFYIHPVTKKRIPAPGKKAGEKIELDIDSDPEARFY